MRVSTKLTTSSAASTAAWREIAELAGLDEEMNYDDATEYDE